MSVCLGVRPLAAGGGDRARQPGAARLGNHPLGQRLRRVGQTGQIGINYLDRYDILYITISASKSSIRRFVITAVWLA